jgi:hypothetical protein
MVNEFLDDDPTLPTVDRLSEGLALVFDGLSVLCRDAEIKADPLGHCQRPFDNQLD